VFSIVLIVAISICFLVYVINKKYVKGYSFLILRCFLISLIGATLAGRLLSALTLLQTSSESFLHNLLFGGFVFYGGLIGGLVSLMFYCKTKNIFTLDICDVFASLLPLGQTVGRIGCYMSGCCYGCEDNGVLSVPYIINNVQTRVFPTWFFEAGFCLLLVIFFQVLYRSTKLGMHTAIYLIVYPSFRFINEFFRGDAVRGVYGWISTSQIISILLIIVGFCVLLYSRKRGENNVFLSKTQPINV
jgi:phosphatidylglycerol:prolipoprotein diacylglycerol transferase